MTNTRTDIYTRITNRILADLEQGVRPWHRPWNAEHAAGKITRPLRHNGIPYKGGLLRSRCTLADVAHSVVKQHLEG